MSWLIVFLAEYLPLVIGVGVLAFLLVRRERKLAQRAVLAALLALAVSEVIKQFFYVPRPFVAGGFVPLVSQPSDGAFPSSHTAVLAALVLVVYSKFKRLGLVLAVTALLVGWGRVLGGVHYPVDVVGGVAVGWAASFLAQHLRVRFR